MRKHLLLIFVSFLTAFSASVEVKGFVVKNSEGLEICYDFRGDGTVKVLNNGAVYSTKSSIMIPAQVTYAENLYTVTAIDRDAFTSCSNLETLNLPSTLNYIGQGAFRYCTNLSTFNCTYASDECVYASADNSCLIFKGEMVGFARYNKTEYTIPSPVDSIDASVFENCTVLTTVNIPSNVKKIKESAFVGCTGLTTVNFDSNSVELIKDSAFEGCTGLTSVTIPESLTAIGEYVFGGCKNLESIYGKYASDDKKCLIINDEVMAFAPKGLTSYTIPDGVNEIGNNTFKGCTELTSVKFPTSLTSIGNNAFNGCTGLTELNITEKVYEIHTEAFLNCTGLKSVFIPTCVRNIQSCVFMGCTSLTEVTIPGSVKYMGGSAFKGCTSLTTAVINEGDLERIPPYIFENCTSLSSVTFPDSIPEIGALAFNNTAIYNNEANWEDNVLYIGKHLIAAKKEKMVGSYTIKDGTILVANSAFVSCDKLTDVTMPTTLKTIGSHAFYGCTGLTSVTFPYSIKFISFHCFEGCTGLTEVVLPRALNQLGDYAFKDCTELRSVIFTSEPYLVGPGPFEGCTNLKKGAYIGTENPFTASGLTGVRYDYLYTTIKDGCILLNDDSELYYVSGNKSGVFTLPNLVRNIGENTFYGCDLLTDIVSPRDQAPSFEAGNFEDYYAKVNLKVPSGSLLSYFKTSDWAKFENIYVGGNKVTDADDSDFTYRIDPESSEAILVGVKDPAMTAVTVPEKVGSNNVTVLGKAAFKDMTSMATLTLNSNLVTILEEAFSGCSSLKGVTIPASVSYIGDCAFSRCSDLISFNGKYAEGAENECLIYDGRLISFALSAKNCESYTLPSSVTHICKDALNGYTNMNSLVLPYTLEEIGDRAFYGSCLKLVTLQSWTFPALNADVFGPSKIDKLQVPKGLKIIISSNEKWNNSFSAINEFTNPLALTDATGYTETDNNWHTSASYTRTFKNTYWQGLCLPFDMELRNWSSYGEISEFSGVTGDNLEFTTLDGRAASTEAGKPYLFKPYSTSTITFEVEHAPLKACSYLPEVSYGGYTLKGTYKEKDDMKAIHGYGLYNGTFYYTDDGEQKLSPFRVFLTTPSSMMSAPVHILIDGEDASGIEGITIEGQAEGQAYNLMGIPVSESYKGIVIVNGQKVIRK